MSDVNNVRFDVDWLFIRVIFLEINNIYYIISLFELINVNNKIFYVI